MLVAAFYSTSLAFRQRRSGHDKSLKVRYLNVQYTCKFEVQCNRPMFFVIRYDTMGEFNVDSKAEYSALSSTRSQKKKLKQTTPVPL